MRRRRGDGRGQGGRRHACASSRSFSALSAFSPLIETLARLGKGLPPAPRGRASASTSASTSPVAERLARVLTSLHTASTSAAILSASPSYFFRAASVQPFCSLRKASTL